MKYPITTIAALVLVGCGPSVPDISIHKAAEDGNIEAVKQHLAAGTDVNAKNSFGETVLHSSKTKEIAELLIAKGADVNAERNNGGTPLHDAAANERKETAEFLIDEGADVNAKNKDGEKPLDLAIEDNYTEIFDLLRKTRRQDG